MVSQQLDDELKRAYGVVAKSPEGKIVLRHILSLSGYHQHDIVVNPTTNEVCTVSSLINVAIRGVWGSIRRLIPVAELMDIEIKREETPTNDDRELDDIE